MIFSELTVGQKFLIDPAYIGDNLYIMTDMGTAINMRTGCTHIFPSSMPVLPLTSNDVIRRLYNGHNSL